MPCVFKPGTGRIKVAGDHRRQPLMNDDMGGLNRLHPKISEMGGMVAPNTHFWGKFCHGRCYRPVLSTTHCLTPSAKHTLRERKTV